jgi:hypothetical protein
MPSRKPSRAIWIGEFYYRQGNRKRHIPPSWRNRRTGEIRKTPPDEQNIRFPEKINPQAEKRFGRILQKSQKDDRKELQNEHIYNFDKYNLKRNQEQS